METRNYMSSTFRYLVFAVFFSLTVSCPTSVNGQDAVKPKTSPVPDSEKAAIEKIVRDYLLTHPEVIREAIQALQEKEENQKKQETSENMKKFNSEIYMDADAPVLGNAKGDVTVVVFYDYFCSYCRKTIPGIQDLVAKDAALKIIYKQFPILGSDSLVAAKAALAAERQGKFTAFHQAMLASESASDRALKSIADKIGLDYAKFQKDMNDPKIANAIARNMTLASSLNVDGTPAYLVGDQFIPGAISTDALAKIVVAQRQKHTAAEGKKAATSQK